jgi:hypothetical protein
LTLLVGSVINSKYIGHSLGCRVVRKGIEMLNVVRYVVLLLGIVVLTGSHVTASKVARSDGQKSADSKSVDKYYKTFVKPIRLFASDFIKFPQGLVTAEFEATESIKGIKDRPSHRIQESVTWAQVADYVKKNDLYAVVVISAFVEKEGRLTQVFAPGSLKAAGNKISFGALAAYEEDDTKDWVKMVKDPKAVVEFTVITYKHDGEANYIVYPKSMTVSSTSKVPTAKDPTPKDDERSFQIAAQDCDVLSLTYSHKGDEKKLLVAKMDNADFAKEWVKSTDPTSFYMRPPNGFLTAKNEKGDDVSLGINIKHVSDAASIDMEADLLSDSDSAREVLKSLEGKPLSGAGSSVFVDYSWGRKYTRFGR